MSDPAIEVEFQPLLDYLRASRGFDFTGYKVSTLYRRTRKRMQQVNLEQFSEYIDYLEVHPEEFTFLFNTILINVTAFFRDPVAWDFLRQETVPRFLARKGPNEPVRTWSAGCSSGEEAYTLAMVLAERMGEEAFRRRVKIYATDIDEEALAQARQANYDAAAIQAVPAELRERYFEPVGPRYAFRSDLRRAVVFGRHDLLQDAPISRIDLLLCRNTLMYFNAEAQGRILARLHFALNDEGALFLGRAEMLILHSNLFSPVEMQHRIFTRVTQAGVRERLTTLPDPREVDTTAPWEHNNHLLDEAFSAAPLAQVVLDQQGHLALVTTQARAMFGLTAKDLGQPFQDLELSYRPVELRSVIQRAKAERRQVNLTNVECAGPGGLTRRMDVQVSPLREGEGECFGISISFLDVTNVHWVQQELQRAVQERETASEELQSTNEELETTNEELQSTVEELQTTNEELQSVNEELETMNEELQSTNEELRTANDEGRQRAEDLNRVNQFLDFILSSLEHGAVVVDANLTVQLWNDRARDLWGLRSDEAVGRSLLDLEIGLPVHDLESPVRAFIAGQGNPQELISQAINRKGMAITCRITLSPSQRGGVVLLMEEIDR